MAGTGIKKKWFLLLMFFSLCIPPMWGVESKNQNLSNFEYGNDIRFEQLTTNDGLSNATVLSAVQDQDGFIWFATQDGLNRFDGSHFTIFRADEENPGSISSSNVFALLVDENGILWIGTDGGGLNKYDSSTETFMAYMHDDADPNSISNDSIWSLFEDSQGTIWAGTRGGLCRFDKNQEVFKCYLPNADDPTSISGDTVYRMFEDHNGILWFATRYGLNRYDSETDSFQVYRNDPENPFSLSNDYVTGVLEDCWGNFWVTTRYGGLNRFDRQAGTFTAYRYDADDPHSISSDNLWNIYQDRQGVLWITTEGKGLNKFDPVKEEFVTYRHNPNDPASLSNDDTYWMMEDQSGVLWITTRRNGVNKLYPALQRFSLLKHIPESEGGLNVNNVHAIWKDGDDILWVGTVGGGLNRIDRKNNLAEYFINDSLNENSFPSNDIYALYKARNAVDLWIGTVGQGLIRFNTSDYSFVAYERTLDDPSTLSSDYLTAIEPAPDGKLWIGTLGFGFDLFNPETGLVEKHYNTNPDDPQSLIEGTVYDFAQDSQGNLWIATARGGVDMFDPRTEKFTHHQHNMENKNSLVHDSVNTLYLENEQILWVGTSSGLSRFDIKSGIYTNYKEENGLPSNTIYGILVDEQGIVWISTGNGLAQLDQTTQLIRSYDLKDGLQGNQFNLFSYHEAQDGEMFFGGSGGINSFYPEGLVLNQNQPTVVFTELLLFNSPIKSGTEVLPEAINKLEEVVLNYDQSIITINYAATSYQISNHNRYQYRLLGFTEEWSPLTEIHSTTFTNLDPGPYIFQVRATNNDGILGEIREIKLKILPPWWQTIWFRAIFVLFLIGVIGGGIWLRSASLQMRNQELEQNVAERTKELSWANSQLKDQIEEINALKEQLSEQVIRDPLTNLYNRRYLSEMLERELIQAERENGHLALLLIDGDYFKRINDNYGHNAGDRMLIAISDFLRENSRQSDLVYRYGGEEFLILMPRVDLETAMIRANEIRDGAQAIRVDDQENMISITVSVGVSVFPQHGKTKDILLKHADEALYAAKQAGRNRVCVFEEV